MKTIRLLRAHIRQMLSIRLWLCIIVTAVIQALSVVGFMQEDTSVWYLMQFSVLSGSTFFTLYLLPAFSYSSTLAEEWSNRSSIFWTIRGGIREYTASKIITTAISGFITVWAGLVLFAGIASIWAPVYNHSISTSPYEAVIAGKHPWLGLIGFITDNACSGAIVAAMGMMISTWIMNSYIAFVSPLAIFLCISRIVDQLSLPGILNPMYWIGANGTAETAEGAILEKLCIMVVLVGIMSLVSMDRMERRQKHET